MSVCIGPEGAALVDTGYCTHSEQTVALVARAAWARSRCQRIFNTHLHSDHCGGNAALQAAWPGATTHIPPGQMALVEQWDAERPELHPHGPGLPPLSRRCAPAAGHRGALGGLALAGARRARTRPAFGGAVRARSASLDLCRCAVGERLRRGVPGNRGRSRL